MSGRGSGGEDTPKRQERFLAEFRKNAIVGPAANAAGVNRRTVQEWRDADPAFAARYAEAEDAADQALFDEAVRRGLYARDPKSGEYKETAKGRRIWERIKRS
jgi:hypothetical protein